MSAAASRPRPGPRPVGAGDQEPKSIFRRADRQASEPALVAHPLRISTELRPPSPGHSFGKSAILRAVPGMIATPRNGCRRRGRRWSPSHSWSARFAAEPLRGLGFRLRLAPLGSRATKMACRSPSCSRRSFSLSEAVAAALRAALRYGHRYDHSDREPLSFTCRLRTDDGGCSLGVERGRSAVSTRQPVV